MWCTIVFWACGIQVEYVCKSSTHQGLASQKILLQQCRPYDVKCIETAVTFTMFVLGIINAMMNLKQFGPLVLIYVETNWPSS